MDKNTFEYKYSKYKTKYNLLKAKYISLQIKCGEEVNKFENNEDNEDKILIMGGFFDQSLTNSVDMMVIDKEDAKISWRECKPMIKPRIGHSAYYYHGEVLSVCSDNRFSNCEGINERYDVLSQKAVVLEHKLPIPDLCDVAMAELDGKVFVIGGKYYDFTTGLEVKSNRVFCLDEGDTWIEQERKLNTARDCAAAATYQGKMWLAGGLDGNRRPLSSVEVFGPHDPLHPLVRSWQEVGNLTKARQGSIALFVIKDDLFAAGVDPEAGSTPAGRVTPNDVMWIEKRDGQTGAWRHVSAINDPIRYGCALAACGSIIYFLGGRVAHCAESWDSFDTIKRTWASQQEQYRDEATRKLPRDFSFGQAVCITPH